MIPTLLLSGLIAGGAVTSRHALWIAAAVGTLLSVLWGLVVGVDQSSVAVAAGGFGLALANYLVGLALVGGPRWILRALRIGGERVE